VFLAGFEERVILLLATFGFRYPILGELTGLNVLEGALHALLHGGVDDLRADNDVPVLRGLGDREAHAADPGLIDHVDDQLKLVQNLEIGHLGLVSSLDQRLESGLNKCCGTTTENGLLAEEIGLGLFLEGGLEDAAACAADALGPGEGGLFGIAALVLVDGDEGGDTLSFLVLAADGVTGALGSDHDNVNMLGRLDRLEVDREAVAEEESVTRVEIWGDILLIDLRDCEIGNSHKDHVGLLDCIGRVKNLETEFLGDSSALALGVEADDDLDAALLEVEGMGVSLGTEADHGTGFSLEELQVGIFAGVDFSGHGLVVFG